MYGLAQWRIDLTIGCLLLAMALSAWIGWRRWAGVAVLGLISLAWLSTIDKPFEGRTLWTFNVHHGIVLSDLVGIVGLAVAGVLSVRLALRR